MNALALDRLAPERTDRILEIGFGGGDLLAAILRAQPLKLIGVDLSESMVKRARRRFHAALRSGQLALHCGSVEALSLGCEAVDKAVSVNSLYFWPDPERAFAELARVVRPGGRLVLAFEPPEELRKWPGHRHGFRLYDARQLVALARHAGFGEAEVVAGVGRKPDHFLCLSLTRLGANG
jgi:arsenite methyltransferase